MTDHAPTLLVEEEEDQPLAREENARSRNGEIGLAERACFRIPSKTNFGFRQHAPPRTRSHRYLVSD